jgi:hypothetical protein
MSRRIRYYRGKLGLSKSAPPGAIITSDPIFYYCVVNEKLYCSDTGGGRKRWVRFPTYKTIEELKETFPWEMFEEMSRLEVLVNRNLVIFEQIRGDTEK